PRRSEKLSQCVGRVPRHKATGVARPGFPAQNFSRQRGWGEVHRTHVNAPQIWGGAVLLPNTHLTGSYQMYFIKGFLTYCLLAYCPLPIAHCLLPS
ncbi:hypothetical protein, partial [Nostoc sp. FACHB-152]|uniref:hypothetical protein n=1 Tax=Nostoc sp. FACHB-152 TaxID=2692837 RepID=UPI001A7E9D8A